MDSMGAFMRGEAARAQGAKLMVFDWHKAAERIRETKPRTASAGLRDDWDWTGGTIYTADGIVPESHTYTYLASVWAIPELKLDDGDEEDCWLYADESPGWDSKTYWPRSALDILMRIDQPGELQDMEVEEDAHT